MSSKENDYDALGARMKRYEAVANNQLLIPDLPLYFRIDGRHFSKLTKSLGYPFNDLPEDKRSFVFSQIMRMTASDLMNEFKCDIIETHSDEISGGFINIKRAPFDGKYFKLVSNLASFTGMAFYKNIVECNDRFNTKLHCEIKDLRTLADSTPSFDCRVVQVPDLMELANCFIWRQNDCIRGCINQYAQRWFTHKQLLGKSQEDRIKMLLDNGHDITKIDDEIFFGYWLVRRSIVKKIDPKYAKFNPGVETMVRTKNIQLKVDTQLAQVEDKIGMLFGQEN